MLKKMKEAIGRWLTASLPRVAHLTIEDNSIVVLRTDGYMSAESAVRLKESILSALKSGDLNCLVLEGGLELSVIHRPAKGGKRARSDADEAIGGWLSAALDDPAVCEAMKDDIRRWMDQFSYAAAVRVEQADRSHGR